MRTHTSVHLLLAACVVAETIKITATSDNAFEPELSTASEGDILEFHFESGNHSVVRGEFNSINGPCAPINDNGFFSGFFSGDDDHIFRVTVNSTEPMVFYCSQVRKKMKILFSSFGNSFSSLV